MKYQLINTLSESRAFRSQQEIDQLDGAQANEFLYVDLLSRLVLMWYRGASTWSTAQMSRTAAFGNFDHWRVGINDTYALAYRVNQLAANSLVSNRLVFVLRGLAQASIDTSVVNTYLIKLEKYLKINNPQLSTIRRNWSSWKSLSRSQQKMYLQYLTITVRRFSVKAEVLPYLERAPRATISPAVVLGGLAAAALAGLWLGLRFDPRAKIGILDHKENNMPKLNEQRPTRLFDITAQLEKLPQVDHVISVEYTADGIAAFVRTVDGNAYEFQIRPAPYAERFAKQRGRE